MRANSLGSYPCSIDTRRNAPNIFSLTILTMPSAASSTDIFKGSATACLIAALAAAISKVISPPINDGGKCPKTTLASVTAGSVPPLP